MSPRYAIIRGLALVLLLGGATFGLTRFLLSPAPASDELSWLVEEFNLSAEQTATIRELHEAYEPVCAAHCEAVHEAKLVLDAATTPEARVTAEAEWHALQQRCHNATLEHLQRVANVMDPEQAARYLALTQPRLSGHDHGEPFGLQ